MRQTEAERKTRVRGRREKRAAEERKREGEKGGDGRRIPVDGEIVTSHCGVPYGTAADGSTLPAACRKRKLCQHRKHTREEGETSGAEKKKNSPRD